MIEVLVVDGDPRALAALKRVLEAPDYSVVAVTSGEEALVEADEGDVAVVLLDLHLPGMDGLELAAQLRSRGRGVPLIFMTAEEREAADIYRAYSLGGVDYLVKPLDPQVVRGKVGMFVELFRQRRSELEAKQAEAEAHSARQAQEEVLACVSHDMKGPLSALFLSVGKLGRRLRSLEASGEHLETLETIRRAGEQLDGVVEELLDYVRFRAGLLELDAQREELGPLLHESLALATPLARSRSVELRADVRAPEQAVLCDRRRLQQALARVIAGAIHVGPEGGAIVLRAEPRGDSVVVTVVDDRPGGSRAGAFSFTLRRSE